MICIFTHQLNNNLVALYSGTHHSIHELRLIFLISPDFFVFFLNDFPVFQNTKTSAWCGAGCGLSHVALESMVSLQQPLPRHPAARAAHRGVGAESMNMFIICSSYVHHMFIGSPASCGRTPMVGFVIVSTIEVATAVGKWEQSIRLRTWEDPAKSESLHSQNLESTCNTAQC